MADTSLKTLADRVSYKITCAGQVLADTVQVISIHVRSSINQISVAEIEILNGDIATQLSPHRDSDDFKLGAEVMIEAGYGSRTTLIFAGIVTRIGMQLNVAHGARLIVECRDQAVRMTINRNNANYVNKTDSDIFSTLIRSYGLQADVNSTSVQHKELVQYYCSDWDFLVSRAEANGMIVLSGFGKITVQKPQTSIAAALIAEYGGSLIEFKADMDSRNQLAEVKAVAWNPATQAIISQTAAPQILNRQESFKSAPLTPAISPSTFRLQTPVPLEQQEVKNWADSQQLKSSLSRIRGHMKIQGSAKAVPGRMIEVKGIGARFSGSVLVSVVHHELAEGEWFSEVDFGQAADWLIERRNLIVPPATELVSGITGLQLGVIKKLDTDPANEKRVLVSIPLMEVATDGVWARLSSFYASNQFGEFFLPEIGDEVVLGYLNNDPSYPVVLGSLYSSNHVPPGDMTEENNTKAIVTRSKLRLAFDDDKKAITVITPAHNQIVVNDGDKSIMLKDQNGNKLVLDINGITLDSAKDVVVKAQGKITMAAMNEISATSQTDVKITGMNVMHTAQVSFTAKGNASAEISASGQTTVRGAMVMIN